MNAKRGPVGTVENAKTQKDHSSASARPVLTVDSVKPEWIPVTLPTAPSAVMEVPAVLLTA